MVSIGKYQYERGKNRSGRVLYSERVVSEQRVAGTQCGGRECCLLICVMHSCFYEGRKECRWLG